MEPAPSATAAPVTLGTRFRFGGIFVLSVIAFLITQVLAGTIASRLFDDEKQALAFEAVNRPLGLLLMLLLFIPMARFLSGDHSGALASQGLALVPRWRRDLLLGSLLGAGMIVVSVIAVVLLGGYHPGLLAREGMALRLLAILWVGFTAAAMEEVAFRGYPFMTLIRAIGPAGATLLLALLFGFIHLWNPHPSAVGFVNTALVSVLFSIAYLRTSSLWMPIGLHFAWNLTLGTVFGLPVSGVDIFAVAIKARAEGPLLLTGGDYGIEASLTGTAVILVGIGVVYLLTPAKKDVTNGSATDVLSL